MFRGHLLNIQSISNFHIYRYVRACVKRCCWGTKVDQDVWPFWDSNHVWNVSVCVLWGARLEEEWLVLHVRDLESLYCTRLTSTNIFASLSLFSQTRPSWCDHSWREIWSVQRVALLAADPGGEAKLGKVAISVEHSLCCAVRLVKVGGKPGVPLRLLVSSSVLTIWMAPVGRTCRR